MTCKSIFDLIPEIVKRTTHDGGMTIDLKSSSFLEPKDLWYYPKYPSITQIVDVPDLPSALELFLASNSAHLKEENIVFGTWLNPRTGKVYIDINTYNKDEKSAKEYARQLSKQTSRQIVSIYNPLQSRTEYISHSDL